MKKAFLISLILVSFCSCSHLTVKDKSSKAEELTQNNSEMAETEARKFIQNAAALQYIDYATVIKDTAYIGIPSRYGREHYQDNTAATFLGDLRKAGKFTNIICCKVINTGSEFIWNDSIVSGQVIGFAEVTNTEK